MLKDTVFCFISICCLHVQALTGFEVLSATVVGFFFFFVGFKFNMFATGEKVPQKPVS